MKAAWYEQFGSAADVLIMGEQAKPAPAQGQVLVRLTSSGVNPSDVKKRAGSSPVLLDDGLVIEHSFGRLRPQIDLGVPHSVNDAWRIHQSGYWLWNDPGHQSLRATAGRNAPKDISGCWCAYVGCWTGGRYRL